MLNETSFIEMIKTAEALDKEIERWADFGIELYTQPIHDLPWKMFDLWVKSHFDSEGQDWINWYLWERISFNTKEVLPCYHEDGTAFYVNNPEDLWDLVKHHRLKPCLDQPCTFNGIGQCTGL